jgi:hypothetical protein
MNTTEKISAKQIEDQLTNNGVNVKTADKAEANFTAADLWNRQRQMKQATRSIYRWQLN